MPAQRKKNAPSVAKPANEAVKLRPRSAFPFARSGAMSPIPMPSPAAIARYPHTLLALLFPPNSYFTPPAGGGVYGLGLGTGGHGLGAPMPVGPVPQAMQLGGGGLGPFPPKKSDPASSS